MGNLLKMLWYRFSKVSNPSYMPVLFLQYIWFHSLGRRFVPKHWCFMVSINAIMYHIHCVKVWAFDYLVTQWTLYCRYFFAEVFDFFRSFFLIVFHMNILFMIVPLAIRLSHRPCFLAFVYITISSVLKSYPSVCFLSR